MKYASSTGKEQCANFLKIITYSELDIQNFIVDEAAKDQGQNKCAVLLQNVSLQTLNDASILYTTTTQTMILTAVPKVHILLKILKQLVIFFKC